MAGRVDRATKDRLKASGHWEDFLRARDSLREKGYSPMDARAAALGAVTEAGDYDEPKLPHAPPELEGRTASEAEILRWVAGHIDHPNPSPADCPAPFAWTLLRQCWGIPKATAWFVEKLWVKLIPSRAQLEAESGDGKFDGKPTIDLIDRIEKHARDAEAGAEFRSPTASLPPGS